MTDIKNIINNKYFKDHDEVVRYNPLLSELDGFSFGLLDNYPE